MRTVIICMGATALLWGSYPLVFRSAGKPGPTSSFLLAATALVPIGIMLLRQGIDILSPTSMGRVVVAGVMMGSGLVAYSLVLTSPLIAISTSIPIVSALMILISIGGGVCFFGEPLTLQKMLGATLIIAGIFLLRPGG